MRTLTKTNYKPMEPLQWIAVRMDLDELKPLDKNPRKVTKAALDKVKDRLRKRGFHDVVKIDTDHVILSGNVRTRAMLELAKEDAEDVRFITVNVLTPSRELTVEEREAIILESNRHDGEWDQEMLADFDEKALLEAGFPSTEVDTLLKEDEDEEDPYDVEKTVADITTPAAKRGDVYKLGIHTLMCGDSTDEKDVATLMGGVQADVVFTDPPYNMNYVSAEKGGIMNDHMAEEDFVAFSTAFITRMKEASKPGAPFYICSGFSSLATFHFALRVNDFKTSSLIIWVKNAMGMGMNDYRHKHEIIVKTKAPEAKKRGKKAEAILYGWNQGAHYFPEVRDESDVWEVSKRGGNTMSHPTQKPLALINKALKNSSQRGGGRAGSIRRLGVHPHQCGEDRQTVLRHGARSTLRGRHREALRSPYRN